MKGDSKKIVTFLDGADKQFIIPVYQRNYDWHKDNCKRLFDDLIRIIKNNRSTHFFGSIVSINEISSSFNIIDGQQRLTTVSILMIALYNLLKEGKVVSSNDKLAQKIYETYLINKFEEDTKRMKLKPIKKDEEAFERLFKSNDEHIQTSNLTVNYNYFYDRIQLNEITPDQLYEAITRLEIIDISLKHGEDDPQLIFESINSTGLELQEADKIRNYILMDLEEQKQKHFYYDYWNKIEENTEFKVSEFIRYYLTMQTRKVPSINNVYSVFREYVTDKNLDLEVLLKDMKDYSNIYHQIITASTNNFEINLSLNRINKLEFTVTYPYLINLLGINEGLEEGRTIDDKEVVNVLNMIETYILRRMFCNYPTNALNKIFSTLHYEAIRLDAESDDSYSNRIAYVLEHKQGSGTFPSDEEFINALKNKDVYKLQSKNRLYIFDKLENGNSKEHVAIYDNDDYSVEHIMPQTLTDEWRNDLGEHAEEIHEEWLHKLANLTMTGYNSSYSNKSFEEKKTITNGFDHSGFKINDFVRKCTKWTEEELKERQDYLIEQCLQMWPYNDSTLTIKGKDVKYRTLADEDTFTSTTPISYQFEDDTIKVSTWAELEIDFVKSLYGKNSAILYQLINSETRAIGKLFSNRNQDRFSEIANDLFIKTGTNTDTKITLMSELCDIYNINPDDILIELEDIDDEDEDPISKDEIKRLRKDFWTKLSEKLEDGNVCKNVRKPTSGRYYDITLGSSGVFISCGINRLDRRLAIKILFQTHHEIFYKMQNDKETISKNSEFPISWKDFASRQTKRVETYITDFDLTNEEAFNDITIEAIKRIDYMISLYNEYKD